MESIFLNFIFNVHQSNKTNFTHIHFKQCQQFHYSRFGVWNIIQHDNLKDDHCIEQWIYLYPNEMKKCNKYVSCGFWNRNCKSNSNHKQGVRYRTIWHEFIASVNWYIRASFPSTLSVRDDSFQFETNRYCVW